MDIDQLKHKLRELKKAELRIRFGYGADTAGKGLVWDEYFCTKSYNNVMVKYPLWKLVKLDKQGLKEAYEEYFHAIYFRKFKENGLNLDDMYDPGVLSVFGLPPVATIEEIKKKFRDLAKKHHPDVGGDSEKMIALLDAYHKLLGDKKGD